MIICFPQISGYSDANMLKGALKQKLRLYNTF